LNLIVSSTKDLAHKVHFSGIQYLANILPHILSGTFFIFDIFLIELADLYSEQYIFRAKKVKLVISQILFCIGIAVMYMYSDIYLPCEFHIDV